MSNADPQTVHATSVAVGENAVLITGSSGSGKSALALEMMARGAQLVADDRTILKLHDDNLIATCPEPITGMIEARGVGVLHADARETAQVVLVIDMDQTATTRMPPERSTTILGKTLPLLHNVASQHFPAAIIQYLKVAHR